MVREGERKGKTQDELEAELDGLEHLVQDLVIGLGEGVPESTLTQINKLELDYIEISHEVEAGTMELSDAIRRTKEILKKLQAFSS